MSAPANAVTTAMTGAAEQLYAVLVTVQNDTLLLPNLAITEIVSREGLRAPIDAPSWFAGRLTWQNQELPVVRFERLGSEAPAEPPGRRTRIAILNCVSTHLAASRFGLLCEGYPHLVTLNRAALKSASPRVQDESGFVLTRVRVASAEAAIPDLEALEARLAGMLAQYPA